MEVTSGETEGRRASRIDPEEGGRYLGIPQNPGQPPRWPVTINPGGPFRRKPGSAGPAVTPRRYGFSAEGRRHWAVRSCRP